MALPELNRLLILLINLVGAFLGVAVYRHAPRKSVNRIFLVMIVLMLIWVNCAYAPRLIGQTNPDLAIILLRIAWTATPLFSASLFFLVTYLTDSQARFRALEWLVGLLALAATLLAGFSGLVIEGIHVADEIVSIDYGPGMWPYLGIVFVTVVATAFVFFRSYRALPPENRLQLQYVGVGLSIFYAANVIFNLSFPILLGEARWYWIGDYSTLAVLGLTGYAIVRKDLFGIRVILTALMVFLIAIVLAADLVVFTEANFLRAAKGLILLLFLYLGYMLVQSVHREIEQREQLQEIAAELRRADEAKTEFISIVSHQLRTPLNAIQGYLSLLLEDTYGKLDAEKRAPVERLLRSSERLIHMVNELLGVSRLETGKIELELEEVDVCHVARSVVDEFSVAAEEKGIELRANCSAMGETRLIGDVQKLRDCILNLVDNAIRYTDKGSVEVSVVREGGDVVIKVKDTGAGIDAADADALFESFQRGDVGRKRWMDGSGLGLYIAQEFVSLHGGKIWAESGGKGTGSTFVIRLPLQRRDLAA
jgi:signal transduction histidine kinase